MHENVPMTIRVGVIGTGNIGTSHARDLASRVAGSVVTALYDFDADRAASWRGGTGRGGGAAATRS